MTLKDLINVANIAYIEFETGERIKVELSNEFFWGLLF